MDIRLGIAQGTPKAIWDARPTCCGNELDAPNAVCPSCGSTSRPALFVAGRLRIRVGNRKRHAEQELVVKDELSRDLGRKVKVERLFGRSNDLYHERITDVESQSVIREVTQPLSEHRGHGSSRRTRNE